MNDDAMGPEDPKIDKTALVVFSGGQDSTTCLGWALKRFAHVRAITFDYNQRHRIELNAAKMICDSHRIPHKVVKLGDLLSSLVTSALIGTGDTSLPHPYKSGLPASFVPCRNALFFTLAHAHAQEIKAEALVTGVCQTDYSGYPDCREDFVRQLAVALNIGYQTKIEILAPLMHLTKWQTFELADEVDFLHEVLKYSHTCYEGNRTHFHEWGFGCGKCPACKLRSKGYNEWVEFRQTGKAPKSN